MKAMKKRLSLLLTLTMLCAFALPFHAGAADDAIAITNPYANVNWETVRTYKTALHTHTNASDGSCTLKESIERHLEAGFDIVATTDHGTVNYSWSEPNPNKLIHGVLETLGRTGGDLQYLGDSGAFDNGVSYTCGAAANGDDYLTADNGRVILRVPYGIENNAVSVNAHVNGWFADYADNSVTTYEDAVRGVAAAGGVCVINHPGEYTKARYELRSENAYDQTNPAYRYYTDKFANLISKYDACIGIDVNSKGDNRTRFDRILWDELLRRFSANGENVFAIASSDAHQVHVIDTGFSLMLMPELTSDALRNAMENGEFFPASHCLGNYDELMDIAAALKEFYGETALYQKVSGTAEEMRARVEAIESGELPADEDIGITYSTLDENGRFSGASFPSVNAISVDDAENTIALSAGDALIVRLISGGKLLDTKKADAAVFDLDDYGDALGDYVRLEVFGEGGILYTQAFLLNAAENAGSSRVVSPTYLNLGFLDFLLAEFHKLFGILSRFFSNLIP